MEYSNTVFRSALQSSPHAIFLKKKWSSFSCNTCEKPTENPNEEKPENYSEKPIKNPSDNTIEDLSGNTIIDPTLYVIVDGKLVPVVPHGSNGFKPDLTKSIHRCNPIPNNKKDSLLATKKARLIFEQSELCACSL